MATEYSEMTKIFKALCDESRLMVLETLRSGEKCACVLLECLHISQPTLSHHMKILCDSTMVSARKSGKWTYYSLDRTGCEKARKTLEVLTSTISEDLTAECCPDAGEPGCCA